MPPPRAREIASLTRDVKPKLSYTKGPDGVGKRLFRMAPFHHHLELGGWPEVGVVQAFYLASLLLASGGGLVAVF